MFRFQQLYIIFAPETDYLITNKFEGCANLWMKSDLIFAFQKLGPFEIILFGTFLFGLDHALVLSFQLLAFFPYLAVVNVECLPDSLLLLETLVIAKFE